MAREAELRRCRTPRAHARVSAVGDTEGPDSELTGASQGRKDAAVRRRRRRRETARPDAHRQGANTPRSGALEAPKDWPATATRRRCRPYLQVEQVHGGDLRVEEIFIGVELSDYVVHRRQPLFLIHCGCRG